jgi:hypothetical protein
MYSALPQQRVPLSHVIDLHAQAPIFLFTIPQVSNSFSRQEGTHCSIHTMAASHDHHKLGKVRRTYINQSGWLEGSGTGLGFWFNRAMAVARTGDADAPSSSSVAFVRFLFRFHLATDRHIKHPYENTMVHMGNRGPATWRSLYVPITVISHPGLPVPGWT